MELSSTEESSAERERRYRALLPPDLLADLFRIDAIAQSALAAATGRSVGAVRRNQQESRVFRDKIAQAAALVSLHDLPEHQRVRAVRRVLTWYGPQHFGLLAMPDNQSIRAVVEEILNK